MEFRIQSGKLLKLLQQIHGVCDKKQNQPILSNVLICVEDRLISLIGSDLEIELRVTDTLDESIEPGSVTTPVRKLLDICRSLEAEHMLHCKLEAERLLLKTASSRFVLSTLPAKDFPFISRGKAGQVAYFPQNRLREMLLATRFAMANNDSRYYLNGMLFEGNNGKLRVIATDGHRLAVSECHEPSLPEGMKLHHIVPRKAVQELTNVLLDTDQAIELEADQNILSVRTPQLEFVTKLIEGRFPDYRRVIPPPATLSLELDRDLFKQHLMRAAILSSEKNRGVLLQLNKDLLRIVANNPDQEEAQTDISLEYAGEPFEIGFNSGYLLDILNSITPGVFRLQLKDPSCSALIQGGNAQLLSYFHVVMPLRI